MNTRFAYILVVALLSFLVSCSEKSRRDNKKLRILATTGMIGDAVKNITGDSAEVYVLMGPGVDPHLYKPTPRDVEKLSEADIIVYNGLHLEGKMVTILEKIGQQKKLIQVAATIPPTRLLQINEHDDKPVYDPHIWFDVALWKTGIEGAGKELANADSTHKTFYLANLEKYISNLDALDRWAGQMIGSIPEKQRLMITAHDAFNYFGKAYKIEVMGLQGISTVAEPGLRDITQLVNLISGRNVKSVFVESSVSSKNINAVIVGCNAKGHKVGIGGTLFSDAMGEARTPEGTYEGMVRHNVNTIVGGLK